ncbi:uncharacterized protein LOC131322031 [Rhododendron vialii]|uniref:uncharacterized protein LOC131322031 n=1 Tax=Rhododendron vialii TaxID=182163 RepID=UPI00265E653D|nr:uncharacterized protein LOC131322031 [Rhododendron vialii]
MIRVATKLSRAAKTVARSGIVFGRPPPIISQTPPLAPPPLLLSVRSLSTKTKTTTEGNPVALEMINYAISYARSGKSDKEDETYARALLVLEQCLAIQQDDNSKGMVLLGMSTLFYERGNFSEAIDRLHKIEDLNISSMGVRVAATEALVGIYLELGQDDTASAVAEVCRQLMDAIKLEIGTGFVLEDLDAHTKAIEGLVKLVGGKLKKAESFFLGVEDDKYFTGNVALSYGEFKHILRDFSMAKKLYGMATQEMPDDNKDFKIPYYLAACNMVSEEVEMAATCTLGQLESHLGNFGVAEEILTRALTIAEKHFGSHHPKVGVILTCIALMFRQKAMQEQSSSLLIQEGLFRRALDLLKGPPLEVEGALAEDCRRDILALARGGYAETLCVQQNRKDEGEKLRSLAESAWRNPRLSLAEALDVSEHSSKVPVVDARISRVL